MKHHRPSPLIPATPVSEKAETAKQRRAAELGECQTRMVALLNQYDAQFSVVQQMSLGPDYTPRYTFLVNVVSR